MAFNFNWSPLTADEKFYEKARDLLTTALNKSPKPPIIVDDILVTEFNLGSVPPELEILEIGDIAEDRFRGIFKMCYSGDAFLTLKTRVQVRCVSISADSGMHTVFRRATTVVVLSFTTIRMQARAYGRTARRIALRYPFISGKCQLFEEYHTLYRGSYCFYAAGWKWFSGHKLQTTAWFMPNSTAMGSLFHKGAPASLTLYLRSF